MKLQIKLYNDVNGSWGAVPRKMYDEVSEVIGWTKNVRYSARPQEEEIIFIPGWVALARFVEGVVDLQAADSVDYLHDEHNVGQYIRFLPIYVAETGL